jgi:hypothetical protein
VVGAGVPEAAVGANTDCELERVGEAGRSHAEAARGRRADDWLSPFPNADLPAWSLEAPSPRRASQQGFLPLAPDDYLALLDWTGRQARATGSSKRWLQGVSASRLVFS